jgi:ketosteroid isomerase-like protein
MMTTVVEVQSEVSIREAAAELDEALEARDVERVVACFDPDCEIELLGVRLEGRDGVRRWLDWVFRHVDAVSFIPRIISVDGDTLIEEFEVRGSLRNGREVRSRWAELLTFRADLVTSLRLYFDPADFAPSLGAVGRVFGPVARKLARGGLEPYTLLDTLDRS